jgi:hypothetical protein
MPFKEDSEIDFTIFPQDQLIELSYVSKATQDMGMLSLMNLLEDAVHRNHQSSISGVLFYDAGIFGQIIEGYPYAISQVWNSINADSRHTSLQVLNVGKISQRRFGNWSMKFFGSDEISKYVPELRMKLKNSNSQLPTEILTLMHSIGAAQLPEDDAAQGHSQQA